MSRTHFIRSEVQRLIRAAPFQKFAISLDSGDRAVIEHPENIAFDPEPGGSEDFYVLSRNLRLFSTFSAVSSIALAERDGVAA